MTSAKRADKDVEGIISQKNIFETWQVKNWNVYPNPQAASRITPIRTGRPTRPTITRRGCSHRTRNAPTKKSGVGRVDGDGYVAYLERWDADNRAKDPVQPTGFGPTKQSATPADSEVQTAQAGLPAPSTQWQGAPAIPAPTLLTGDRPAVRHALPPGTPGALRPGTSNTNANATTNTNTQTATTPPQPAPAIAPTAAAPPAAPAATSATSVGEFGPWMAARPHIPGPVVKDRGNGPTITELRPPVIQIVGNEGTPSEKPIPAIAIVPASGQPPAVQPEKLPEKPNPLPPMPGNPAPLPQPPMPGPPGDPVGKGNDLIPATGDPAADFLRALESGKVGYRIKLEQAIELGVLNAREFQDRREDLYFTALDITLTRFNFAAQAFWAENVIRKSVGSSLNGGQAWNINTTTGVTKNFATGAQLMAQLANQVVIDLSGHKPTTAVSNLSLSLAQPLLQGGGLAVNLEPLTQNERDLVYAMRSYARYRKLFFVSVSAGTPNGYTNNPYGLQGLAVNLGRGVGNNLTAPSVGFLPLLQQQALISNSRKNVATLERLLKFYRAFAEGGQFSDLQVGQVEVQLLNSRGSLLGSAVSTNNSTTGIRGYLDTLDNFKLQMGLPLTVGLELDDTPLRPMHQQLTKLEEVYAQSQAVELAGAKHDRTEPIAGFRKRWTTLFTTSALVQGTPFAKNIVARWDSWAPGKLTDQQLRDRLAALAKERQALLDARADRELKKLPDTPAEIARLNAVNSEIDLGRFELLVREYEAQPWAKFIGTERDKVQNSAFASAYNAFNQVILEARNDRLAALYASWPLLAALPVGGIDILQSSLDDSYTFAIQEALSNRLDLMNARGQVVDAWRQIKVTANALQGVFNVQYDLNSSTPPTGTNPFGFSAARSTSQLTFNAQLPLVRRPSRNAYRTALINYQRARRNLMAFEDNIANDVRGDVRELRTLAKLYLIQQRVVELQYAQVDSATAILFAPPAPGTNADAGSAAALTQQVLNAQSNLVNAQNTLYQLWVAYLTSRMSFYLDLEQMQLDDRGVWIDESSNRANSQNGPGQPPSGGERLHPPRPLGNNGEIKP